jgi:hypothetical protein
MNKIFAFLIVAALFCMKNEAQEPVFPNLPGYKIIKDYPVYLPGNLWDFIDGAADNYLAYGFVDLHVAEYKKGKAVIKCEIYKHTDNTMAFGIYSTERSPLYRYLNLGAQGYITGGVVNFFKGSTYVKIKTFSKKEKVIRDVETLAGKVAAMVAGESTMPPLLSQFPAEGKKVNEETFLSKNVLGHSFLTNAFRARYQSGTDDFTIYISELPTAEEVNKAAKAYIASTGIDPMETGDNKFVLSDGYNGTVYLAWKDKRMVMISGLAKDQAEIADRYTSEILK